MATNRENVEKLGDLIKGIRFAMLTTVDPDGSLRSRPMTTQETEFDGTLWFFVQSDSPKVNEVNQHHQVNVSYADPDHHRYISVSGRAQMVYSRRKMEELWRPAYKLFFPEGLDDPKLTLLAVSVEKAEYWDTPGGLVSTIIGFAQRVVQGDDQSKIGENEKLTLKD